MKKKKKTLLRRPPPRAEEKPVASVRPVQSTPVPMMPRQASAGSAPSDDSSASSLGGFPVNCLQKAGVFVQRIVTTTGRQTVYVIELRICNRVIYFSWYYKWCYNELLVSLTFFTCFRHSDSRHQQLNRCPGQDHRRGEHPRHQGH